MRLAVENFIIICALEVKIINVQVFAPQPGEVYYVLPANRPGFSPIIYGSCIHHLHTPHSIEKWSKFRCSPPHHPELYSHQSDLISAQ